MNTKRHNPTDEYVQEIDAGRRDVLRAGTSMAALAIASAGLVATIENAQAGPGDLPLAHKIAVFEGLQDILDAAQAREDELRGRFEAELSTSPEVVDYADGEQRLFIDDRSSNVFQPVFSRTHAEMLNVLAKRPGYMGRIGHPKVVAKTAGQILALLQREQDDYFNIVAAIDRISEREIAFGLKTAEDECSYAYDAAWKAFEAILDHRSATLADVMAKFSFLTSPSGRRQFEPSSPEQMKRLTASLAASCEAHHA